MRFKLLHECLLISSGFHCHCEGGRCVRSGSVHSALGDGCLLYSAFWDLRRVNGELCASLSLLKSFLGGLSMPVLSFAH